MISSPWANWSPSFQRVMTLGDVCLFRVHTQAQSLVFTQTFATSYLHCHNEDISPKINIPEQKLKRSKKGTKSRTPFALPLKVLTLDLVACYARVLLGLTLHPSSSPWVLLKSNVDVVKPGQTRHMARYQHIGHVLKNTPRILLSFGGQAFLLFSHARKRIQT